MTKMKLLASSKYRIANFRWHHLYQRRDGRIAVLGRNYKTWSYFVFDNKQKQPIKFVLPINEQCWMVPVENDLLVYQENDKRCFLWNPQNGSRNQLEITTPKSFWSWSTIFENSLYVFHSNYFSGSSCGFDFSDNDTYIGSSLYTQSDWKVNFRC